VAKWIREIDIRHGEPDDGKRIESVRYERTRTRLVGIRIVPWFFWDRAREPDRLYRPMNGAKSRANSEARRSLDGRRELVRKNPGKANGGVSRESAKQTRFSDSRLLSQLESRCTDGKGLVQMRASVLLMVGSALLVAGNAGAATFPSDSVIDGVGVQVEPSAFQPAQAQALRAGGVTVVRVDFASFEIYKPDYQHCDATHHDKCCQNADGPYCFDTYDAFVTICAQEGLRVYGILDWGTPYCPSANWDCYSTSDFRNQFDEFVDATVTHFSGLVSTWELWNEPNGGGFWPERLDTTDEVRISTAANQYMDLAIGVLGDSYSRGALQVIRDADPNATIVAPALSYPDWTPPWSDFAAPYSYLPICLNRSLLAKIDGLSAHFYTGRNPETVMEEYNPNGVVSILDKSGNWILHDSVRKVMNDNGGGDIPIVSGEWGYTAVPGSSTTPQVQADYLQRMMLTNFSQGIPLSIWFMDQDRPDTEPDWYFGLFQRYCDANPLPPDCANLCVPGDPRGNAPYCKTTTHTNTDPDLDTYSVACANVCAANPNECWYDGVLTRCLPHAWYFRYGDPKPAFYAMKTVTSNLKGGAWFHTQLGDGNPQDYLTVFRAPRGVGWIKEILAAWTTDTGFTMVHDNQWWGTFMLSNTPLYVGQPLTWSGGGNGNWSNNTWYGGTWPNIRNDTYQDNYQAVFESPATINVDGQDGYCIGGLQFNAPSRIPDASVILDGGVLRFTPGGGNLYVADGFNKITSVLADAYDRGTEPWPSDTDPNVSRKVAFTNTPETFVLRKSGGGEVALGGFNTFHGRVLVGQGILDLDSDQALGDPSNPVTLAGGGIDLNGHNLTTGPVTVTGDSTIYNYGQSASSYAPASIDITKGHNLLIQGGPPITVAAPITVETLGTLTLAGTGSINTGSVLLSGTLYQNSSGTFSPSNIDLNYGTIGGIGTIASNLHIAKGNLSPGSDGVGSIGTLSVLGDVTFDHNGTLDIDFVGTDHDVLSLMGTTLNVSYYGIVEIRGNPSPGTYHIVTGASKVYGFGNLTMWPWPDKYKLKLVRQGRYYTIDLVVAA